MSVLIEANGLASLSEVDGLYVIASGSSTPTLKFSGVDVVIGQFGAWTPISAEPSGDGYEVVWKNGAADQYTVWRINSGGNYTSSALGVVSGGMYALQALETRFDQDLNGDGTVGFATTEIETNGFTGLSAVADRFFVDNGGAPGPALKYFGADVIAGQFGGWKPISAETSGGGYDVVWKNGTADQYTVWHTNSSGHYTSSLTGVLSGNTYALQALETSFAQDLNSDGTTGLVTTEIEVSGSTSLSAVADRFFVEDGGANPSLKYFGAEVIAGQFGGWTPISGEASGGGYNVAWKNGTANQYTVWHTNSSGHYTSSVIGAVSGNTYALQALETSFAHDLNGDGTIGLVTTVIETIGSTSLSAVVDRFFLDDGGASGPSLKYFGADVIAGQFGGWTPISAEASGGGYDVAWKNGTANQYTVWHTNSGGHYVSSVIGAVSGGTYALQALETGFAQDLNGDGTIGPVTTEIEGNGSTNLNAVVDRFFVEDAGGSAQSLKYFGADVIAGQFGAWTPISAEASGGGYDVVWKNGTADQFTVWHINGSGSYASSVTGVVAGSTYTLQALEADFTQDLNNDGMVGLDTTVIELNGATDLRAIADLFFVEEAGNPAQTLKYQGKDVIAGQFGAWTPISAEASGGGYDVVWKNGTADQFTVWHTNSAGNYASSVLGVVSASDPVLRALENGFEQDLNGNGYIG